MIIKPMPVEDFDKTFNLVIENAEELGSVNINEDYIIEQIRENKISPTTMWFNAYLGQTPIGYCSVSVGSLPLEMKQISVINYFYISKEQRSEDTIKELMYFIIDWCKEKGCEEIFLTASMPEEQFEILKETLGFQTSQFMVRSI